MAITNIITQKMIFGGKFLGKFQEKNIFVPFALPGEELRVEITKSARDYDEGEIVEILKPSPHRITPPCPLYQKCGGCNMMHIENSYQVELKKQLMQDVFARAGVELPPINVIAKSPFNYRARMELHDGGLQKRGSNEVIQIENCPIATKEINEFLKTKSRPRGRTMLFGSKNAEPSLTAVELGDRKEDVGCRKGCSDSKQEEVSSRQKQRQKQRQNFSETRLTPNPVELAICDKKILFDAKGFFQSNIDVLEDAIPKIMQDIKEELQPTSYPLNPAYCLLPTSYSLLPSYSLDLYSGCGTFSVFLADIFQHVTMVEHNKGAVVFAEQNMAGKPHSTYAVSGANFVKYHVQKLVEERGNFDLVFADPPRSGMEKEVCDWLCKSDIPNIAYLSCDASTQARDIAKLAKSGYTVKTAWLLDFYPQTSHLETFLLCIKK